MDDLGDRRRVQAYEPQRFHDTCYLRIKYTTTAAENANIRLTRVPISLVAYWKATDDILDKNMTFACSAGELASLTEDFFDEEIAWRAVKYEEKTGKKYDQDHSVLTTMHRNFGEGFWFASTAAYDGEKEINKVVCVDFTKRKVKRQLTQLTEKINNGWLPSEEEIELAEYDN